MNTSFTAALVAASRFHAIAEDAAYNGGISVTASGHSAYEIASQIARSTGVKIVEAFKCLDITAPSTSWYEELAYPSGVIDRRRTLWSAPAVAREACRQLLH